METIDIINRVLKICLMNVFTYFVYIKLINYKGNNYTKMIIIVIAGINNAIIGVIIAEKIAILPALLVCYSLQSLVISRIINTKFQYSIIVTFISLTIAYLTYIITMLISGVMLKSLNSNIEKDNIVILILGSNIEFVVLYSFFKIKRLQKGLSFLKDKDKISDIGVVGFALIGITILIYSTIGQFKKIQYTTYLIIGILIEAICMTIWIKRKIIKYYKQKLKEQTVEELENELKEKDKRIEKILKENQAIATINHKYSNRIKALEKLSNEILSKPEIIEKMKVEFGKDFGEIQNQIKQISEEYSSEIKEKIKHDSKLPKTGVFGIDNILEYMKTEAEKNDIKLDLKVNANINYMVEKVINQSRLETLLGDHIKDAIIAITSSNNTYKSILTTISIIDDCYEICIYDTGIEFEIDTLLNLGTKAITTHKDTGGSGIGFMTTFETLKETKASLIIEEKHPMNNADYTKAVKIRFDSKNEYRICSYRAEKIEEQKTDNRIIVKK